MSYSPTNWVDGTTPVDASSMNKLEQAVSENSDLIDKVTGFQYIEFKSSTGDVRDYIVNNLMGTDKKCFVSFYCGNVSTDITGLPSNYILGIIGIAGNLGFIWCQRYNNNTLYVSSYNSNSQTWSDWTSK